MYIEGVIQMVNQTVLFNVVRAALIATNEETPGELAFWDMIKGIKEKEHVNMDISNSNLFQLQFAHSDT
jgi:hypothetical protein